MKPWEKERRAKEIVGWMYDENPDIWYTPAAVTEENPPYPNQKLSIEDATATFEEMGARGLIRRIYLDAQVGDGVHKKNVRIVAWETNKSKTDEIWAFRHEGWFQLYVVSTFRFLWVNRCKAAVLLLTALGIFVTGFLTQAGQDTWTLFRSLLCWR